MLLSVDTSKIIRKNGCRVYKYQGANCFSLDQKLLKFEVCVRLWVVHACLNNPIINLSTTFNFRSFSTADKNRSCAHIISFVFFKSRFSNNNLRGDHTIPCRVVSCFQCLNDRVPLCHVFFLMFILKYKINYMNNVPDENIF